MHRTSPAIFPLWVFSLMVGLPVLPACTQTAEPPELQLAEDPTPQVPPASGEMSSVAALDQITGDIEDPENLLAESVRDVRLMLLAQSAEAEGDWKAAARYWRSALEVVEGRFGRRALNGWIKAYVRTIDKPVDRQVLARLLLSEADGGRASPYMLKKDLTIEPTIVKLLETLVPEALLPDETATSAPKGVEPPSTVGPPDDDPLLAKAVTQNCAAVQTSVAAWQKWLLRLGEDVRRYWEGLVQQCAGRGLEALAIYKNVYPRLARSDATQNLALEAASRAAILERALDRKIAAADTYLDVVKFWDGTGVTPASMGLDPLAFAQRRIDETLWAARYRAMIGDYENAKIFAQAALTQTSNAYTVKANLPEIAKEQLASYRAEAYQVLAHRIAVELRQFEGALSLNLLALQTPYLSQEWRDRLRWFAGVYDYLGDNLSAAKKHWEGLLEDTKDEGLRAAVYFWLARVHARLGGDDESRFYLNKIVEEQPLSFYATTAPMVAGLSPSKDWRDVFGDARDLKRRIDRGHGYQLDSVRNNALLRRPLLRAEVLVAAKLTEWATMALDDLDAVMNAELPIEDYPGPFVYLTRLQYGNGDFLRAIALTTKLAKSTRGFWHQYPEQLIVYFPQPYGDDFHRSAMDNGVASEMLMAVARQESGFNAGIKSAANAVGIMQLIAPTARRYAAELGMSGASIEDLLRVPAANIRMGSRFLRTLSMTYKHSEPAIFAGYNAGEQAVDAWLKRRAHPDPLMFVELVPFGETREYIKGVWRNTAVYRHLNSKSTWRPMRDSGPRRKAIDR